MEDVGESRDRVGRMRCEVPWYLVQLKFVHVLGHLTENPDNILATLPSVRQMDRYVR